MYFGSFFTLTIWFSSRTPRRSVSPCPRRGRLAWKVKVNMKKTEFLASGVGHDVFEKSGKHPCTVCGNDAGCNSILCSQCMLWKCSGIIRRLVLDEKYVCPRCKSESRPIDGRTVTEVHVDGTMLYVVTTFCYLGDMLCCGGSCASVIAARYCVACGKLRKILPVLTIRHLSHRIRGKVYEARVC